MRNARQQAAATLALALVFSRAVMIDLQRMARTPAEDDRPSCAPPSGSRAMPEPSSFPILTERPDLPPHLTTLPRSCSASLGGLLYSCDSADLWPCSARADLAHAADLATVVLGHVSKRPHSRAAQSINRTNLSVAQGSGAAVPPCVKFPRPAITWFRVEWRSCRQHPHAEAIKSCRFSNVCFERQRVDEPPKIVYFAGPSVSPADEAALEHVWFRESRCAKSRSGPTFLQ